MIRRLTSNLRWKLLALTGATLLWIAVNRETEFTASTRASLEFKNLPEGLEISSAPPPFVTLRIHGPSARLTPAALAGLTVVLDCSSIGRPGIRTFSIGRSEVRRPFGIVFEAAIPSQVQLTFERSVSRSVRVVPAYLHPPPPGYRIASYRIEPPSVVVNGPESHVQRVDAVDTDPIDLSASVGRTEVHLPAHVPDPMVRVDPSTPLLTYKVVLEKIPALAPTP